MITKILEIIKILRSQLEDDQINDFHNVAQAKYACTELYKQHMNKTIVLEEDNFENIIYLLDYEFNNPITNS